MARVSSSVGLRFFRVAKKWEAIEGWGETAAEAEIRVLAHVGAGPVRDPVDARIIDGVLNRTGHIIDSQSQVGGWPGLEAGSPWIDSDGDGMPDDWERTQGLDPAGPADGNTDRDGDGFTSLEDWLNSL
jgi:hypothetical protein